MRSAGCIASGARRIVVAVALLRSFMSPVSTCLGGVLLPRRRHRETHSARHSDRSVVLEHTSASTQPLAAPWSPFLPRAPSSASRRRRPVVSAAAMSRSTGPGETFVSSMDFQFPDEPGRQSDTDDDAGNVSSSTGVGVGASGAGGGIKGRNSAATIVRPGARASKTNALAALTTRVDKGASAASPAADGASSKRNPARKALKVPRAPPLDFSTLRTSTPRFPNPPRRPEGRPTRMFGLEHAPVYHPTIEEFARPMEYIELIAPEAKQFGICKIVPPEGWRPPFALDTEVRRHCVAGAGRILPPRLLTWHGAGLTADVQVQDATSATKLDGGVRPREPQLPRAAVHLPSPAGQQRHLRPDNRQ